MTRSLISKSFPRRISLLAHFLILACACQSIAATVIFDISPATDSFKVEILNDPGGVKFETTIKSQKAGVSTDETVSPVEDFIDRISSDFPHIFSDPKNIWNSGSKPNATLPEVMQPPFSEATLNGKGEKELVALRDGEVSLAVLLSTYEYATMEVHLFDVDGSEIWFSGQSLLYWERPDSKSYAPAIFKGRADPTSMVSERSGDFGPNENLTYKFDIKEGQKIILKTGGNAAPRSFIKASGSAF
ncbi:MAG: hypothetical protein ACOYXC_20620 [Candidatus Rifleibacteriota bacterium]